MAFVFTLPPLIYKRFKLQCSGIYQSFSLGKGKDYIPFAHEYFPIVPYKSFISLQPYWPEQKRNNELNFSKQKQDLLHLWVERTARKKV